MEDNYYNERPEVVHAGGPPGPPQSNALGITALVTGIIGTVIAFCCPYLGFPLGIVAVVCGFIGKSKYQKYAVAGIVLGFVAIGLGIVSVILGQILEGLDWEQIIRELEQAQ